MILPKTCQQYHNQQVNSVPTEISSNWRLVGEWCYGGRERINTEKRNQEKKGRKYEMRVNRCEEGALFVAVVLSKPPGCYFGQSGKQCKQLIKHLRSKPAWVVPFMWARHLSSYFGPPHAVFAMGPGFTVTTHLTAVTSKVGRMAYTLGCGFTRKTLCVHVLLLHRATSVALMPQSLLLHF